MTEFDRVFYDIEHSTKYPGWIAVRVKGHQYPVGWAQTIPAALDDLKHWQLQRERWTR